MAPSSMSCPAWTRRVVRFSASNIPAPLSCSTTYFLCRTTRDLPERGRIGIFNRSYYEEVLIARVHPEILRNEGLPDALLDEKAVWYDRFRSIVDPELHLSGNGTRIVKFYLQIWKEEQRKRFLQRIDDPEKNWKFSVADVEERQYWNQYMNAYGECFNATSTQRASLVHRAGRRQGERQADRVEDRIETLDEIEMTYPKASADRRRELQSIHALLEK